jgi:hypothetical protein
LAAVRAEKAVLRMIATESANFGTFDIAHLLRLLAAVLRRRHPIRSTNARIIPKAAQISGSLRVTFSPEDLSRSLPRDKLKKYMSG